MHVTFHPNAAETFNNRAKSLIRKNRQPDPTASTDGKTTFSPDFHIALELTDNDIIGEPEEAVADYFGRTISLSYRRNGAKYSIDGSDYHELEKLAEAIHRSGVIRNCLSKRFIVKTLFSWISLQETNANVEANAMEYLTEAANSAVASRIIWIPLANVYIQSPLHIARSTLRPLDSRQFETWMSYARAKGVAEDEVNMLFDRLRHDIQGLAAVTVKVEAEPIRAQELAVEESVEVSSVLGILSPALRILNVACAARVKGWEVMRTTTSITVKPDGDYVINQTVVDPASPQRLVLSDAHLAKLRPLPLDRLLQLAHKRENAFQQAIYDGLMIYSKAAFTADTTEKLLYILTSLESTLLKNENEPIQQNLAERLAVLLERSLDGRKSMIKTVRSTYGLRSRYLHHGRTLADDELLTVFLNIAWRFWMMALSDLGKFKTREEFVEAIDDLKLA
jgi:Apea-like HEPN